MSYTRLSSSEIIAFLTNTDIVMNGDNAYSKGVQYKRNASGSQGPIISVYDADGMYFLGSDDVYVRYDVSNKSIATVAYSVVYNKIMAATSGHAYDIKSNEIYVDDTVVEANADMSISESDYHVGIDTLNLGDNTAASADYSIIQGTDQYGLNTSKYLMVNGQGGKVSNSSNVVGALSNIRIDGVNGALVVSADISSRGSTPTLLKDSQGIGILCSSVGPIETVENSYASLLFGIGGGTYNTVNNSILGTHGSATSVTGSICLVNGNTDIKSVSETVLIGGCNYYINGLSKSMMLGGFENTLSTVGSSEIIGASYYCAVKPSKDELLNGVETTAGGLSRAIVLGENAEFGGLTQAVVSVGEGHNYNQWNPYMQMNGEAAKTNVGARNGFMLGDGHTIGYESDNFAVIGESIYFGVCNENLLMCGNSINACVPSGQYFGITRTYGATTSISADDLRTILAATPSTSRIGAYLVYGTGSISDGTTTIPLNDNGITAYIYVSLPTSTGQYSISKPYSMPGVIANDMERITAQDLQNRLKMTARAEYAKKYVVYGTGTITYGSDTIELNDGGITSYIEVTYDTTNKKYVVEVGTFDVGAETMVDLYGPMPSNNRNMLSVGTDYQCGSDNYNNLLIGDSHVFNAAHMTNSVFIGNGMQLTNFRNGYCDESNNYAYRAHEIAGVVWINTSPNANAAMTGYATAFNALNADTPYHTHDYANAFSFTSSEQFHNPMFFGIFVDPTSTMSGFSLDDIIKGYANKPDASMIYTGGIAIGGTGDGCGYGLLKLGDLYKETASYVKTSWTSNTFNADNDVVLMPGTSECVYGGMPLMVKSVQEYDGTFRIGAGKVDARGVNIDSVGKALSAAGYGGGAKTSYGISCYIASVSSATHLSDCGVTYDTSASHYVLQPADGWIYHAYFPAEVDVSTGKHTNYIQLADPTEDDVGKQFIMYVPYSNYYGGSATGSDTNGSSIVRYKCLRGATYSTQSAPGGDSGNTCGSYAFLIPPLPASMINNMGLHMNTDVYVTPQITYNTTDGTGILGSVTSDDKVVGNYSTSVVHTGRGTPELGFFTKFSVVRVPTYVAAGVNSKSDASSTGWQYCYIAEPMSPMYYPGGAG